MSLLKVVLLTFFILLGSWLLLGDNTSQEPELAPIFRHSFVQELRSGELRSISLSYPGEVYTINCEGQTNCTLTDPVNEAIDQEALLKLLQTLDSFVALSRISAEQQIKDGGNYGVSGQHLKIELHSANKTVLYFGDKNKITNRRYLRIEGETDIFTVDDALYTKVFIKKKDIRPIFPVQLKSEQIQTVQSSTPTSNLTFKKEHNRWVIEDHQVDLDQKLFTELVDRMLASTTVEFIDTPPPFILQQLKDPYLIATLTTTSGEEKRLSYYSIDLPGLDKNKLIEKLHFLAIAGRQTISQILPPRISEFNNPPLYFQERSPFSELTAKQQFAIEIATADNSPTKVTDPKLKKKIATALSQLEIISTLAPAATTPATLSISLADSSGRSAKLTVFSQLPSATEDQDSAPYMAEILYFTSVKVHAIISAEDVAAIKDSIKPSLKK